MSAARVDGDRRLGTTFAAGETVRVTKATHPTTAVILSVESWGYRVRDQYGRERLLFHYQVGKAPQPLHPSLQAMIDRHVRRMLES